MLTLVRSSWIAAPSAALLAFVLAACTSETGTAREATSASAPATSTAPVVAGTALAAPHIGPAGEWQMPAGDYAGSRYSELAQITPANAKNLRAAWTF
jgi:glucose dehydrogenase